MNPIGIRIENHHFFLVQRPVIRNIIRRSVEFIFHAVIVHRAAFFAFIFRVIHMLSATHDRFAVGSIMPLITIFAFFAVIEYVARKQRVVAVTRVVSDRITVVAKPDDVIAVNININLIFRVVGRLRPAHKRRTVVVESVSYNHLFQIIAISEIPVRVRRIRHIPQYSDPLHRNVFEFRAVVETRAPQRTAYHHAVFIGFIEFRVRIYEFRHTFGQDRFSNRFIRLKRTISDVFHRSFAVLSVVIFCKNI